MATTKEHKSKSNTGWRKELQHLLKQHNERQSLRGKAVNHRTQKARADGLCRILKLLRDSGYLVGPSSLGGSHIEFLMHYWTADPRAMDGLRVRGSRLPMLQQPFSASYIQQQLSFLRALCAWTGKRGLVLPARRYVDDAALVSRARGASPDRSTVSNQVDRTTMLDKVAQADPVVGLQLDVLLAFGLQRSEAVAFCPTLAEVPPHALPAGAGNGDYLAFVRATRGRPTGRVRLTAIRTDEQRAVFERAKAAAPRPSMHIGRPGLSLKQAKVRFSNVLRRCGVSLHGLGVTAHALRQEFSSDLYFKLRTLPDPMSGGPLRTDPSAMESVYVEVGRQLTRRHALREVACPGVRQQASETV
jgi:hypothetical protein